MFGTAYSCSMLLCMQAFIHCSMILWLAKEQFDTGVGATQVHAVSIWWFPNQVLTSWYLTLASSSQFGDLSQVAFSYLDINSTCWILTDI